MKKKKNKNRLKSFIAIDTGQSSFTQPAKGKQLKLAKKIKN